MMRGDGAGRHVAAVEDVGLALEEVEGISRGMAQGALLTTMEATMEATTAGILLPTQTPPRPATTSGSFPFTSVHCSG